MYRRAVHSFRVRRVPLPDNTLQRTVDSSTCHLTILLILTSQSLLLRKTIVQERVRGALKPAALTPLLPVSSSRRTQTDSLQESRRPRDQFLLSRSAGISPRVLPVSVLLTTLRERISPKQSCRASQLFLGPPRLATRVGRARKHERIGRGGRKRAKRRGGGGRRCPRCPALRALRHRTSSAPS